MGWCFEGELKFPINAYMYTEKYFKAFSFLFIKQVISTLAKPSKPSQHPPLTFPTP